MICLRHWLEFRELSLWQNGVKMSLFDRIGSWQIKLQQKNLYGNYFLNHCPMELKILGEPVLPSISLQSLVYSHMEGLKE